MRRGRWPLESALWRLRSKATQSFNEDGQIVEVSNRLRGTGQPGQHARLGGVYGSPTEGKTAQEVATPAFARALGLIACDLAAYAAERRIGAHKDTADVRRWAKRVHDFLVDHDPATGEPVASV